MLGMIGVISLGIWMLLITSDLWIIMKKFKQLEWEIDKLHKKK